MIFPYHFEGSQYDRGSARKSVGDEIIRILVPPPFNQNSSSRISFPPARLLSLPFPFAFSSESSLEKRIAPPFGSKIQDFEIY